MIHRGVFDAFPKLKIILGHFGEAFPFLVDRVNAAYRQGFGQPLPEIQGGYKNEPGTLYQEKYLDHFERQLPPCSVALHARSHGDGPDHDGHRLSV